MQNVASQDDLVLVLSRKVLEAADLADFAKSRSLGKVIVESDADRARDLMAANRFSYAFIGLPDSELRGTLLNDLSAGQTHVVLVDDSPAKSGDVGLSVLSRPYTDVDLESAISMHRPRPGLADGFEPCKMPRSQNIGNPNAA